MRSSDITNDERIDQKKVINYLEEPQNDPFVLRDLLYSQDDSRSVGDVHLEYDRSFKEIKSQIYDLKDLGLVKIDNPDDTTNSGSVSAPAMNVNSVYELTDEANSFFYSKPYTLEWAYNFAQSDLEEERQQKHLND